MIRTLRFWIILLGLTLLPLSGFAQVQKTEKVRKVTAEDLMALIEEHPAKVKVVNFWATWCSPCVEEFPDFMRLGKDLAEEGVEVIFVSMDFEDEEEAVADFLENMGWEGPFLLRTGKDHVFIEALHPDWSGVVPATIVYGPEGSSLDFWQGKPLAFRALKKRVQRALHP